MSRNQKRDGPNRVRRENAFSEHVLVQSKRPTQGGVLFYPDLNSDPIIQKESGVFHPFVFRCLSEGRGHRQGGAPW